MNTTITLCLFAALSPLASCQKIADKTYILHTEIVDDRGKAVFAAVVEGQRLKLIENAPLPLTENIPFETTSDESGVAQFKFQSIPTPGGVAIQKPGYYSSFYPISWLPHGSNEPRGDLKAILKPIKNPIAMHASLMTGERVILIPEIGKDYGYDLQLAALVAPHGKGKHDDFQIRVEGEYNTAKDARLTTIIRFKDKEEGLLSYSTLEREYGSVFLGDYEAPASGYQNELRILFDSADTKTNYSRGKHHNYYFKTRTVRDAKGNVVESNYGKIHGDLVVWALSPRRGAVLQLSWIASYFNPTPNDRNVEFDPKKNLNPDGKVVLP